MVAKQVLLTRPEYTRTPITRRTRGTSSTPTQQSQEGSVCSPRKRLRSGPSCNTYPNQENKVVEPTRVRTYEHALATSTSKNVYREGREGGVRSTPSPLTPLFLSNENPSRAAACNERVHDAGDSLLAQLLELSDKERKALMDRVSLAKMLERQSSERDRDISMWTEAVYHHVVTANTGGGATGAGPQVLKRLLAAVNSWTPVSDFMQESKLHTLEVVERQAVYYMMAELLVSYVLNIARHTGSPFSAKMVANCTSYISGVVDAAFPGYAKAGLLHLVARRRPATVKKN